MSLDISAQGLSPPHHWRTSVVAVVGAGGEGSWGGGGGSGGGGHLKEPAVTLHIL